MVQKFASSRGINAFLNQPTKVVSRESSILYSYVTKAERVRRDETPHTWRERVDLLSISMVFLCLGSSPLDVNISMEETWPTNQSVEEPFPLVGLDAKATGTMVFSEPNGSLFRQ